MAEIPYFWRRVTWLSIALLPLSYLFEALAWCRQKRLKARAMQWRQAQQGLPRIVVVGNITVGGNGKTPVVIALVRALQARGEVVAVISRGYGGHAQALVEVGADTPSALCGDEPKLIAQSVACPVVVGRNRQAALEYVMQRYPNTQWVISDDGLQHYALPRDVEWVVVAPDLRVGNGLLLPAGPLRESVKRLATVDAVVFTGEAERFEVSTPQFYATMENSRWYDLAGHEVVLEDLQQRKCVALTAIARPERFFQRLSALGLVLSQVKSLPDHALLPVEVAEFAGDDALILMTSKDAVKLEDWADALRERVRVLEYQALLPQTLVESLFEDKYE